MRFILKKPHMVNRPGGWRACAISEFGNRFSRYVGNGPVGVAVQRPVNAACELHLFADEQEAETGIAYILGIDTRLVRAASDLVCPREDFERMMEHDADSTPVEKRQWLQPLLMPWLGVKEWTPKRKTR